MAAGHKKIVAIIPARGGSKRIPHKNIIDFNGKPMIAWTIEAARKCGLFDKIVVSTDSEEIAAIGMEYGAEVPFLRDEKADDYSHVSEGTIRTLVQMEEQGEYFTDVVQLFAVCPLRNSEDIINSYRFFEQNNAPFVLSCFEYAWMNPWWSISLNEHHEAKWVFDKAKQARSQDLPKLYSPTGAIWIAKVKKLKKEKTFYGKGHIFWKMDWKRAVDIDNYEDLDLAVALSKMI